MLGVNASSVLLPPPPPPPPPPPAVIGAPAAMAVTCLPRHTALKRAPSATSRLLWLGSRAVAVGTYPPGLRGGWLSRLPPPTLCCARCGSCRRDLCAALPWAALVAHRRLRDLPQGDILCHQERLHRRWVPDDFPPASECGLACRAAGLPTGWLIWVLPTCVLPPIQCACFCCQGAVLTWLLGLPNRGALPCPARPGQPALGQAGSGLRPH